MKILFISDNYPPETNAAATRVSERAKYWQQWQYQVSVITCAPNFPEGHVYEGYQNHYQTETVDGIRVVRVKTYIAANEGIIKRIADFVSFMLNAYFAARKEDKPDVVVATSPQFFAGIGGALIAKHFKVPFVLELSDLWPKSILAVGAMRQKTLLSIITKLELWMYRQAKHIIVSTPSFAKDLISRGVAAEKITPIINGVELSQYQPLPKDTDLLKQHRLEGKFVIGYLGTLGMAHNLMNVMQAAEKLQSHPNIVFLFVGAGADKEKILAYAKQKNLSQVVFVERQPKEKMPAYWSICDMALVHLKDDPTFAEVIPSKIFEAMAMGLPILFVGPEGEGSKIIHNADCGKVIAADNPALLAAEVIKLAAAKEPLAQWGANAKKNAVNYSREKQARDFIEVLERI